MYWQASRDKTLNQSWLNVGPTLKMVDQRNFEPTLIKHLLVSVVVYASGTD